MKKEYLYILIFSVILFFNSSLGHANSYGSYELVYAIGTDKYPSINNRGDIIWEKSGYIYFKNGKTGSVTTVSPYGSYDPGINDLGEIVWRNASKQIVYRDAAGGIHNLANGAACNYPDINNYGTIVYYSETNGRVETMDTSGTALHNFRAGSAYPSINDQYNGQSYVAYQYGGAVYRELATGGSAASYATGGVPDINNSLDVAYYYGTYNRLYYHPLSGSRILLANNFNYPAMNDYGDIVCQYNSSIFAFYNLDADRVNLSWSGTGDYSNNLNWNYYIIPDETHQIHVEAGTLNLDSSDKEALGFEVTDGGVFNLGGYDYLINSNSTVQSNGELVLAGGELNQDGSLTLTNSGTISGYGTINPAITNNGEISVSAGETLTMKADVTGGGIYELNTGGKMIFEGDLTLGSTAEIHNTIDTYIDVYGDLINNSESPADFVSENLEIKIYNPITGTHEVVWEATDFGQSTDGLDDNFAIGSLVFGDDLGGVSTDLFNFSADSIIYCYGLSLLSDASLNLNGATIYYLNDGYTYNGITGTGFSELGIYSGGNIYPIFGSGVVPEPASLLLLGFGVTGLTLFVKGRRM